MDPEPEISEAKAELLSLRDKTLSSLPPSKISPSSRTTLHRLLSAELRFLSRCHHHPLSLNLNYLRSLLLILHHPSVHKISRVCKPISSLHVDVVCTLNTSPAWFFVSARNPSFLSWNGSNRRRGVRSRILAILSAAHDAAVALKPSSVFLFFSRGLDGDEVALGLAAEFGAVEFEGFFPGESGRVFEIKIGGRNEDMVAGPIAGEQVLFGLGDDRFAALVFSMRTGGSCEDEVVDAVNFDTTTLVALVSGISNGGSKRLLEVPEFETRSRFKGNYDFVIAQAMSELEHPILDELGAFVVGKMGIICESVHAEFKELVTIIGGPCEKSRADLLLKHLKLVPDCPSERVASLPTTRKVAMKNKITFGTGDRYHAPTLTANMGFIRAISQIGMSLLTLEHQPRALIGE